MKETFMSIWIFAFIAPLLAGPIEKERAHIGPFPTLQPVVEENWEDNIFGQNEIDDSIAQDIGSRLARDEVCISEANPACQERCVTSEPLCMCGTNGKTYQNHCEMTCERKVNMELINMRFVGNCDPISQERLQSYKSMVKDLVTTEYLKQNVRKCGKLMNCNQAKHVLQFVTKGGEQSISECPENLPSFYLFTGLDCKDYVSVTKRLTDVLSNEPIINCKLAKRVNDKLFNKKHCAWDANYESNEKEIINWSFDALDINFDRQLVEQELEILENVPDMEVMFYYFKHCDKNRDGYLREDEWSSCLGCEDCYRPCNVYMAQKAEMSKRAFGMESMVRCEADGTCAPKQCRRIYGTHEQCWCVDRNCREIPGTETFAHLTCPAN